MDDRESIRPVDPTEIVGGPNWAPPLSLKLIAFLFILLGALGITEMILRPIVFGKTYFDPVAIVFVLIGLGLFRWRNAARVGAVVVCWLLIAAAMMIVFIAVYAMIFPQDAPVEMGIGPWRGGPGGAIIIGIAIGLFAYWQLRVLHRPDIVWLFKNQSLAKLLDSDNAAVLRRRWRFSLGTLFLLMTITAFVLLRLTADGVLYDTQHQMNAWGSGAQMHGVEYGVRKSRFFNRPDKLLYVVLSTDNNWRGYVNQATGNRFTFAQLRISDGKPISLPAEYQLFEVTDGRVGTRDEHVSKAELDDFVASQPSDWTLDSLIKHAERMRAKQKEAGKP